ncbi:MAG: hypothetical protein CL946_11045 [Ectothiorhodospiraceae bacterium]|nr:hypothetical protein [Ectothiorhodospiraceae bacterium]
MLRERFDLVATVHEEIARFRHSYEVPPTKILLSPRAFEWLLAVFREDQRILGVSPIDIDTWTYTDGKSQLSIVIDEMLDDYTIVVR